MRLPVPLSRSSAGPGGGLTSLFFRIGKSIIRLEVVREMDEGRRPDMALRETGGRFDILRGRRVLARDVRPLNAGFHAPGQVFINLHDRCRFRCAFCTLPVSPGKGLPAERWAALIKGALSGGRADAVALTTGVPSSPSRACRDLARLVRSIRRDFPSVPIGVEPYTIDESDLRLLRSAGATELKLNIQCATAGLMERVCPDLDREGILWTLVAGVRMFGKGRVCSNLLVGLGETDRELLATVRVLAALGVAVNLRPLRLNALNRGPLGKALGKEPEPPDASRMLRLASAQKRIFAEHGLDPSSFRTMCHRCTACDIEPFVDI
jgi:biotin synthase-related radical SAM superfamily protein